MLRKMTWVYAAIALALAVCWTAATARAYPRPELSPLIHAADLGGQYATAWLVSNAASIANYPTSNDLNHIVDGFVRVHTGCFPRDMVLVGYSAALGTVFHTNWFSPLTRVYRDIDGSMYVDDALMFPLFWRYRRARVQPWLVTTAVQRMSDSNAYIRTTHTLYVCWFSLFEYGVFMGNDFRMLPNTDMQIDSPVHCNGILSLGMTNATPFRLTDFVTCSSNIFCVTEGATVTINNHNAVPKTMLDSFGNKLDSSHPFWKTQSQSMWGGRWTTTTMPWCRTGHTTTG